MSDGDPLDCSGHRPSVATTALSSPPPGRRGHAIKPKGTYEFYKEVIETAVRTDAPPSPELIVANSRLAQWEAYLGIGKVSSFPVNLYLAVTDLCNARCLFCSYAPESSSARILRVSDIARADWLKFVECFYPNSALGDALVHPQIAQILGEVRRLAPFIKMGMTTNAALLTDEVIEAVVGHLSMMAISLNAARKETYEHVMSPLKWEVTLGNLQRLTRRMRELGTDKPDIQASIVVHKHNLDELPELPAVLSSIDIRKMRVLVMNVPKPIKSRQLYTGDDLVHHHPAKANAAFAELRAQCVQHGISLVSPLPVLRERQRDGASEGH
jgi:hypothetical protein